MADRCDPIALKALVEGSGIQRRQNRKSWIFACPRCSKRDKLYIRKTDGRFVCWSCTDESGMGYSGRPEYALRDLLGMSLFDILLRLYGEGGAYRDSGAALQLPVLADFFDDNEQVPYDLMPLPMQVMPLEFYHLDALGAEKGRAYMEETRGVPLEVCKRYGVMYHPRGRRVIFPIVVNGRLIGWQGRLVEDEHYIDGETGEECTGLKILTEPSGLDRNRCLMFQDRLLGSKHAVLTEGPLDAIKADLCGGNVATMGKKVSPGQLELLRDAGIVRLYVAVDPDAAAEINRLCREFSDIQCYHLTPAAGFKDLGAMSPEGVFERFRVAPRIRSANVFLPPLLTRPSMAGNTSGST